VSRTVLITGASMGIGAEIAREFARPGYDLILTARSEDLLEGLAGELRARKVCAVHVFPADLSAADGARSLFERVISAGHRVDILINNAGFGVWGHFRETSLDREMQMIQVNVAALTALTKYFLRPMVERGSGRICNIASTAAFQPGPLMAVYYATKAYVMHFTEALANELAGTGVKAVAVCPGPTASQFVANAGLGPSRLFRRWLPSARSVATEVYRATLQGPPLHVCGWDNWLMVQLNRFVPRRFSRFVVRQMQEKA
jgi:short-subunit dehydrogenase